MVIGVFTTSAKELNEADFEPTHNVIKVNYGPGLVFSEIHELNTVYKTSSSYDLSVDYCHTFNKGFGFGVNVIQSHLNAMGAMTFTQAQAYITLKSSRMDGISMRLWA